MRSMQSPPMMFTVFAARMLRPQQVQIYLRALPFLGTAPGPIPAACWRRPYPTAPVDCDLIPLLLDAVINQRFARFCDGPDIARVMLDDQSPPLCFVPEPLAVIGSAPAAILHVVGNAVEADYLVHHGRHYVFDRPIQRFRPELQLMPPVVLSLPRFAPCRSAPGPCSAAPSFFVVLPLPLPHPRHPQISIPVSMGVAVISNARRTY